MLSSLEGACRSLEDKVTPQCSQHQRLQTMQIATGRCRPCSSGDSPQRSWWAPVITQPCCGASSAAAAGRCRICRSCCSPLRRSAFVISQQSFMMLWGRSCDPMQPRGAGPACQDAVCERRGDAMALCSGPQLTDRLWVHYQLVGLL